MSLDLEILIIEEMLNINKTKIWLEIHFLPDF